MSLDQTTSHLSELPARSYPVGAAIVPGGVHFRVWAPRRQRVAVMLHSSECVTLLTSEANGYFSGLVPQLGAGAEYSYLLDDDPHPFPDPVSFFQPRGPHGPSQVVDLQGYSWSDGDWPGLKPAQQVLYELHIGTFTEAGTWNAASQQLHRLKALGITAVEIMPVAESPGEFFWGYDGVSLFAPARVYGTPDDFRRFVETAHRLEIGVILDVVYNHWGPDGNYLGQFSADYATRRYQNDWGEAINFDGPNSAPVREYFNSNAAYWIKEYHLDGLRLDATHQIYDESHEHLLRVIGQQARAAALPRSILLIAENDDQQTRLVRPLAAGGEGLDALWNDDFHHAARVALTGRRESYYARYRGTAQEFVSLAKRGMLYQGQRVQWRRPRRGASTRDLPPTALINYLENHDQVAHSADGARLHQLSNPGRLRAMTAFLLLSPQTPMLFQGQEYGASQPFLYFADHHAALAAQVKRGRAEFLAQFPTLATPERQARLPDPAARASFARCKLKPEEPSVNDPLFQLHRDLIHLRQHDTTFRHLASLEIDGAVLSPDAFVLKYFHGDDGDRLVLVNLGAELLFELLPEPLLAPPAGMMWDTLWSSEAPVYGGLGTACIEGEHGWRIPGYCAIVLSLQDEVRGLA